MKLTHLNLVCKFDCKSQNMAYLRLQIMRNALWTVITPFLHTRYCTLPTSYWGGLTEVWISLEDQTDWRVTKSEPVEALPVPPVGGLHVCLGPHVTWSCIVACKQSNRPKKNVYIFSQMYVPPTRSIFSPKCTKYRSARGAYSAPQTPRWI